MAVGLQTLFSIWRSLSLFSWTADYLVLIMRTHWRGTGKLSQNTQRGRSGESYLLSPWNKCRLLQNLSVSHYYPFPALLVQSWCQTVLQKEEPSTWPSVPSVYPPFWVRQCVRIINTRWSAVHDISLANPFSDFPIERQKRKSKKSGFGFLNWNPPWERISRRWNPFSDFAFDWEIWI